MSRRGKTAKASTAGCGDRLSALSDDLLHHILGFLEAGEAVRTCVLARRWRHLWRPIPHLRVTDVEAFRSVDKLNGFVDKLFLLRDAGSVLDECELDLRGLLRLDDALVGLWIRRVLACRARVLRVHLYANVPVSYKQPLVRLADQPLLSQHLARLELNGVYLKESFLDFSSCLVLEDLKIADCVLDTDKIFSQSLKHATIRGSKFLWDQLPTHISAPSLVSLQLDDCETVPVLESMPLLETAYVNLNEKYEICCLFCDFGGLKVEECVCAMSAIYWDWDNHRRQDYSVLLEGLSSATYLELIASPKMLTFTRDLRCCPTFSKLTSLLLNDWCLVGDYLILLYFLHHTPVLEKLTLQLRKEPKPGMKLKEYSSMEQSLTLTQLKILEVKCHIIDERVHNITKILSSCSISLSKINIQKLYSTGIQSLKHISITGCQFFSQYLPTHISAPSLITLQLRDCVAIPLLESMPLLETASVNLGHRYEEYCYYCDYGGLEVDECVCGMFEMYRDNDRILDFSVLLEGLSSATCLELTASHQMVIFRRDLRCCPTFSKLRSLSLTDWCLVDLQMLLYFLHHTPVLENLTLELCKEPKSRMEGISTMEKSLTLGQLKIVEVKCQMIDKRVHKITKILSSCSVSLAKIIIQKL